MIQVKIKPLHPDFKMPVQAHPHDAGFDCHLLKAVTLVPGQRAYAPLGFAMEIPPGYEAQMRPRSGLAKNKGLTLVNSPGTIDAGYRGEVGAILHNVDSENPIVLKAGERTCQIVIAPVPEVQLVQVEELSEEVRGEKGFGSTGVSALENPILEIPEQEPDPIRKITETVAGVEVVYLLKKRVNSDGADCDWCDLPKSVCHDKDRPCKIAGYCYKEFSTRFHSCIINSEVCFS